MTASGWHRPHMSEMEWLSPWYSVIDDSNQVEAMKQELLRELAAGHVLHGVPVRTLGRRLDNDDVLFAIEDGSGRFAVVHLTWKSNPPDHAPWPRTVLYPSQQAWLEDGLRVDHREFIGELSK